jgi:hypothetical protein
MEPKIIIKFGQKNYLGKIHPYIRGLSRMRTWEVLNVNKDYTNSSILIAVHRSEPTVGGRE